MATNQNSPASGATHEGPAATRCEVCGRLRCDWNGDGEQPERCWRPPDGVALPDESDCYRLGYERLLAVIKEAPHDDHCASSSHYAPPWADDCNCWKRPFLPPEQQRPSNPAAREKYK